MAEPGVASNGEKRTPLPQPGIILYPALGNPELVSGVEALHLLICLTAKPAEMSGDAGKKIVARHLKFMSLDESELFKLRRPSAQSIHADLDLSLIKEIAPVTNFANAASPIWQNEDRRFYGLFRSSIVKYFTSGALHGYTDPRLAKQKPENVYHVKLDGPGLRAWIRKNLKHDAGLAEHCFANWVTKPWHLGGPDPADVKFELPFRELEEEAVTQALGKVKLDGEPKYVGKRVREACDAIIDAEDESLMRDQGPLRVFDVFEWRFRMERPFALLHPIFFYEADKCLNVGWVSDLHVVSRLEVLRRTDFQLIPGAPANESPKIATMINSTTRAVRDIMNKMGAKPTGDATDGPVDILAIGGDLVDFAMSSFPTGGALPDSIAADRMRNLVNAEGGSIGKQYDYGVDFMSMYQLVTEFYRTARKPVVILAGNHDAYDKPYGMSPRVLFDKIMANAGIPADNNLTVMEAALAFGDSYGSIVDSSNFDPKVMDLFYLVFTPIFSFTSKMSKMQWVSLGWGDDEDLLWDGPGWKPGHLPNAENAVSSAEIPLINKGVEYAAKDGLKCLMLSHYTWACYEETRLINGVEPGNFPTGDRDDITWFNLGSCELNRRPVYEHFQARRIHYTISGHAHRSGVYVMDGMLANGDVRVRGFEVDRFAEVAGTLHAPYMIVADSAGPIPRENVRGEFNGVGSNRPAGVKLTFDPAGNLAGLRRVQSTLPQGKPRLAVTMDYVELMGNSMKWFFQSNSFWLKEVESRPGITQAKLNDMVVQKNDLIPIHIPPTVLETVPDWVGLVAGALHLVMSYQGKKSMYRFPLVYDAAKGWCIRDPNFVLVRMRSDFEIDGFLTIQLGLHTAKANGSTAPRYDVGSPWNVVVGVELETVSSGFLGLFGSDFSITLNRVYDMVKYPKQSKYRQLIPN